VVQIEHPAPDVGDEAPDFDLLGSTGERVRLSDLRGTKRALLLFYPKDFTSG
jgi:mycoredoxin-dependent peroxiredoxin